MNKLKQRMNSMRNDSGIHKIFLERRNLNIPELSDDSITDSLKESYQSHTPKHPHVLNDIKEINELNETYSDNFQSDTNSPLQKKEVIKQRYLLFILNLYPCQKQIDLHESEDLTISLQSLNKII